MPLHCYYQVRRHAKDETSKNTRTVQHPNVENNHLVKIVANLNDYQLYLVLER